jgi:AraC-like DNA-binding protein
MAKFPLATMRYLEQLLQRNLIPLAQNGAPLILFDAPPRSKQQSDFKEKKTKKLTPPSRKKTYPGTLFWPSEHVNSIGVPVLGCVFEGEADFDVRNPPGKPGHSWIVPVRAGFFVVRPGIPFSADKVPWERPDPKRAYARCMVFHLRYDGINFRPFTVDKGKIWKHPSLFLHEPQAHLLGERLLQELSRPKSTFDVISYHYMLLIFYMMQRCLVEGRYTLGFPSMAPARGKVKTEEIPVEPEVIFPDPVNLVKQYIGEHLEDKELSLRKIALNVGFSSRHLDRLFREQESISLFDYLQYQKLMKARQLLQNPAVSIEQVAIYCGFRQRSHFSAWFTRQNHSSPSAYRAQLKNRS